MLPQIDYLIEREYLGCRVDAIRSEVERSRSFGRAGSERRAWLSCQICHTLWHLGRLLVAAGGRLERRYASAALQHSSVPVTT